MRDLEDAGGTLAGGEMLAAVAGGIAYRAVRNRGTIGGSLAHADPAADWPVALAALGATVNRARRPRRAAICRSTAFVLGAFTTALDDDEIIESIACRSSRLRARWGYYKFCRKAGEFAEASAAAVFDPERAASREFSRRARAARRWRSQRWRSAVASHGQASRSKEAVVQALRAAAPDLDAVERRMRNRRGAARARSGDGGMTPRDARPSTARRSRPWSSRARISPTSCASSCA